MNSSRSQTMLSRKSYICLSLTALFAALIAAGTFISIPLPFSPVPIVLQNMFAVLSGIALGPVFGAAATGLYLLAGAIGAPVFAGATGGFVHFAGPTGGFLFGYLLSAALAGLIAGFPRPEKETSVWRLAVAAAAGMLIVYVPGVLRLKTVINADWKTALAAGFFPFLIGDIVKCVIAVLSARRLRKTISKVLNG